MPMADGPARAGRARVDAAVHRLVTIPGIRVLNATALVAAVGDASAFSKGRDLAAWLGLVPRQHTTGGRPKLLGITKRGNKYLRMLFIHGARAAMPWIAKTQSPLGAWLRAARWRAERQAAAARRPARLHRCLRVEERRWPDGRPAPRQPGSKNGIRCRQFYEDQGARISILAAAEGRHAGYVDADRHVVFKSRLQTGRAIRF